jgi:hypothetical protein
MFAAALSLVTSGCGTSDSIKSISLSANGNTAGGSYNLGGVDAPLQLIVTANYTSGKTIIVTNSSSFAVTPQGTIYSVGPGPGSGNYNPGDPLPAYGPDTVPIDASGLMEGIAPICTWIDPTDPSTGKPFNPAQWEYTGYYNVTATYREFTSQPIGVGVGVASSNVPGCGPS